MASLFLGLAWAIIAFIHFKIFCDYKKRMNLFIGWWFVFLAIGNIVAGVIILKEKHEKKEQEKSQSQEYHHEQQDDFYNSFTPAEDNF